MKTTTVLLASGKRVSWFNVSYVKAVLVGDEYEFTIYWKYKAQIRKEIFTSPMKENQLNKYFASFGLVPLVDNVFINLSKVLMIDEEAVHGPVEKTRIRMVFTDGFEMSHVMVATQWAWWKQSYV